MEEEEGTRGPEEGHILIRIHVPELNVQKCLQFPRDQLVWDVKQQCLASLPKELKESFNYGLFYPPENGRAGKFLDEERRLGDYPFNGPVGYLELKYKRRVYKMISLDEKQLKSLHTRANLRRFLDYVQNDQVEKITKMCSKGLDPNFHCQDSGETPLTIATGIKKPARGLIALVNGGALLDYRTKDGSTAMHRSVEHRNLEALRTLLELGASPNYKDGKGLTPLYYCVSTNIDPAFTETLLHDHATTGAQDVQGWQEVHQACKNGLLAHLEHLLFYGADMNARNASGNTPLHVCAVNGQESCTRHLLFRGADPKALNYANQTPCQVAVIAGNMDLAELIQNYKPEDVVPFRGLPSYNPKRRSAIGWLQRAPSMSTLATLPPSPCPSDRSLAPFSSASSSLSDGSIPPSHETDTASIVTEKSLGDTSDIISDSSGVGTSNSDTTNCSISITGSTVVCIESYCSKEKGHISIREGDIIEVTGATDDGYLEGNVRSASNRNGYFPAHCVQEVRLRHHNNQPPMIIPKDYIANYRILGRRESTCKQFATAPRAAKKTYSNLPVEPRTVVLHKGKKGFGFILRGAKATSPLMELTPSQKCPALQYLDDVDPGGIADMAGLKKGDFLLEINKEDVSSASHEHVVDLIRNSGDLVQMTVLSLGVPVCILPMSKSTNLTSGIVDIPSRRHYATLPRKMNSPGGIANRSSQAPLPPRRDPKTTLSVGRARAKSMVAGLADTNETDISKSTSAGTIHQSFKEMGNSAPVQPKTASIRQRPTSSRGTTHSTLVELFQNEKNMENSSPSNACHMGISQFQENTKVLNSTRKGRVYASVAEMKRINSKYSKTKVPELSAGKSELKRTFHSTPDLVQDIADLSANTLFNKFHKSQEDISVHTHRNLPPPTHPPPPIPPQTQVVQVDICTGNLSEYDTLNRITLDEGILSSFRPTSNAKLYASPEDVKTVGYRSKSLPSHSSRSQIRKSQSMRTAINNYSNTDKSKQQTNPYAQPTRASRSQTLGIQNRRNKLVSSKSTTDIKSQSCIPSIPEPDYSCTDSEEGESEEDRKKIHCIVNRINCMHLQQPENSGNSITSGSSSGCNSGAPNFSVEEIQRGRMLLRSSKSYPENLLKKHKELEGTLEDGDNSSSGVSSDQEITSGANLDYNETISHEHNSMTLPSMKGQRQQIGLLKRQAVSLAQLPPPIENENDEKDEFCLPPPPEFGENTTSFCEEIVVAPPPQFSDRQISRVRIVGSVPKTMNTLDEMKHS